MADFTTGMTSVGAIDDSVIALMDQQFIIASGEEQTLDEFASIKREINSKSIDLVKYARLAAATTPLTDKADPDSVAISDSKVTFTPAEYGIAVTTTLLASLQSGGKLDLAAPQLVGKNLGQTKNELAIAALIASSNGLAVNASGAAANTSSDTMTLAFMNKLYNKLARASVPKLQGGQFVLIMHDDVAHDVRALSGWTDVQKYASAEQVLKNEIGSLAGFRCVVNNAVAGIVADEGAGAVDNYKSIALGANGLGLAESKAPSLKITGPFDKLGRFVNVGWMGCFQYKIVDSDAVWVGSTASSIGANT